MKRRHRRKRPFARVAVFGIATGLGLAIGLALLSAGTRIANLDQRVSRLEQTPGQPPQLRLSHQELPRHSEPIQDEPPIEISGWFVEHPVQGPHGHYVIQPQIRNNSDREIQMIEAFLLFRTRTGDVICAMDLTRNLSIPAGGIVMEPQSHRVGWERLSRLNLSELRARDIVADLQIGKVVYAN